MTEEFLREIINEVSANLSGHLTESERTAQITKKVIDRLHIVSSNLVVRLNTLVKTMVEHDSSLLLDDNLANISVPELSLQEKVHIYCRMFNAFISDPECVSFRVANQSVLGNLTCEMVFILTLFSFATCRRVRSDGILCLVVSGKSSTGKSQLIEAPLLQIAHQLVSSSSGEAGCGRFQVNSKSLILLTDIPILHLFGPDCERFKTIARAEPTTVKIHSSVQVLPPCFLLITTNDRLHDHTLPPRNAHSMPVHYKSTLHPLSKMPNAKKISSEHLRAVRARFLECHVVKQCQQRPDDLRNSDLFSRQHMVLGLYMAVLNILEAHGPDDFVSKYLFHYAISGLEKNASVYAMVQECLLDGLLKQILQLKIKYKLVAMPPILPLAPQPQVITSPNLLTPSSHNAAPSDWVIDTQLPMPSQLHPN